MKVAHVRPIYLQALIALMLIATSVIIATFGVSTNSGVGYQGDFPHARVLVLDVLEDLTLVSTPPINVQGIYRPLVKLADISPLEGAREKLLNLLSSSSRLVYLDLDPQIVEDGKAVATVYVRINETHILNVNKWLVDNGYARIVNAPNVFDPSKWILYFIYPVESERLPIISRVVLCENCTISNATTWGINTKTTPDRTYFSVTYTLNETPQRLRVAVLNSTGEIVRHEVLENTSVALGYVDIATNGTGFFLTWRDLIIGPNRARCAFIPTDPQLPVNISDRVFTGGGSWHSSPIAAWNYFNESWVVVYVHQTLAWRPRYFINFVNRAGLPAGGTGAIWLSSPGGTNRTGIDIQGRLIYDPVSKNFVFVSRNETMPGDFNIEVIIFPADKALPLSEVVDVTRLYIDDSPGPQGPEPTMFNASFSYFNLWPSIHSQLLASGRYLLVIYNDTSRSLAYSIIDLLEKAIVTRGALLSLDVDTTFYPWISGGNIWITTWSSEGVVNASIIQPSTPFILDVFTVSELNSRSPKAVYDTLASIHALAYTVEHSSREQGIYMVFIREANKRLEPWILPVRAQVEAITPLSLVTLKTSGENTSTIGIVALEENNLVVYIVNHTYPYSLEPVKNAIPVYTPTPTTPVTPIETVTVTTTKTITTTITTTAITTVERTHTTIIPTTITTTQELMKTTTIVQTIEEKETITQTTTLRDTLTLRETISETKTITQATTVVPPEAEYANIVLAIGVIALISSVALFLLLRRKQ